MAKSDTTVGNEERQEPKIIMSSEEYGSEQFDYDTLEEAEAGLERLKKKCSEAYQEDGIERRLLLVLADWSTDQECGG